MRLSQIRIKNFRCYKDETIQLDDYNCFVGPNGAGKSTVLIALNTFFQESSNPTEVSSLTKEDFHLGNTEEPIEIEVTFTQLSEQAENDLDHYVRQGQLVVTAVATWDREVGKAAVKQRGSRLGLPAFRRYFEAEDDGASATELKKIYRDLRNEHSGLPNQTVKAKMAQALYDFEADNPETCELIPSEGQFYGFTRGTNKLAPHVQWIYIPAVKSAVEEDSESRATALGQLLQRSIRRNIDFSKKLSQVEREAREQIEELMAANNDVLSHLSGKLQGSLQEWAHPGAHLNLEWAHDETKGVRIEEPFAKVTVGEGDFRGELVRSGHGLQRSFLVALLQEAARSSDDSAPTLILGFEEPELYQHPPQARHLASVLEKLSQQGNQVILTTHSPYFVTGDGFPSIRLTRKNTEGIARVTHTTEEEVATLLAKVYGEDLSHRLPDVRARIQQILNPSQSELFFCDVPILVEGVEEIAILATHLDLTNRWDDFRQGGCHFVMAQGKGNLARLKAITNELCIESFMVFDGDGTQINKKQPGEKTTAIATNVALLKLSGEDDVEPLPGDHHWGTNVIMWKDDIQSALKEEIGQKHWDQTWERAGEAWGITGTKRYKKTDTLLHTVLTDLHQSGHISKVLDDVCDRILDLANSG